MLRRLHLLLAALAMLIAPLAMQSGIAMAAMPMNHGAMAKDGHCGESAPEDPEDNGSPGAVTQCCVAMCAAVAPRDAGMVVPMAYHGPMSAAFVANPHRPFLAELPTPPPRLA
jgi:hypothetical protein